MIDNASFIFGIIIGTILNWILILYIGSRMDKKKK